MARTAIPPTLAVLNGTVADPAGTAIVAGAGNGGQIVAGNNIDAEKLFLRIVSAGANTLTLLPGVLPLANDGGHGGLAIVQGGAGTIWAGPFDSARFEQNDGSLIIESTAAATVSVFRIPRH